MSDLEAEKALAAARAVEEVRDGMLVGLGTGSTAAYAVRRLAERIAGGLRITGTATSRATETLAGELGIPLVAFDRVARVDLTIDGADEIDPQLCAIKGGGGALLREKIVAAASDRVIVVGDSTKPVSRLGRFRLPVEAIPFAAAFVQDRLAAFGVPVTLRLKGIEPFLTDQGNHIFDIAFESIADRQAVAAALEAIPGVVEHGLFLDEIDTAVIARGTKIDIMQRQGGSQ
jgi:ribose 5-phosphate isomerase A